MKHVKCSAVTSQDGVYYVKKIIEHQMMYLPIKDKYIYYIIL